MSLGSVGSNPYSQLQNALETARERTGEVKQRSTKTEEKTRTPRSSGGGALFQRLYGNSVSERSSEPVQLGARFDTYA